MYIDAFAGSGECTVNTGDDLLTIEGSAKIAIQTSPHFDEFHFIEENKSRFTALENLRDIHS